MYDRTCSNLYLRGVDYVKKSPFRQVLDEAIRNQYRSASELRAQQLAKLNTILRHAVAHSSYYRETLHDILLPLTSLDQVSDLPVIDKGILFERRECIRTSRPRGREFSATTSGSTGIAMRFFTDSAQWAWSEAAQWRGRSWWNVVRSDRQVVLWGRPVDGRATSSYAAALKYRLRNAIQFNTFEEFDERKVESIVRALMEFQPRLVYGYGSSVGRVARYMDEKGIVLRGASRPNIIEYTADHMLADEVRTASRVMGGPVLSAYGASEAPGISQQCWAGNSHISTDNVMIEFLRPDGTPADPEETGEIVVTTLNNFAMPLIRYRVGDSGAPREGTCRCGVNLPLMDLKIGKAVELIHTSSHANVSAHVLDYINIHLVRAGITGIRQFFVEQTAADHFRLDYVREEPFTPASVTTFQQKMREHLGDQVEIEAREVARIPLLPSGKRRYFRSSILDGDRPASQGQHE